MTYLERFFEEKELGYEMFEVEDKNGNIHMIDNETVINLIHEAPREEKQAIKKMLIKLDFANQPINPFLKHLAEAYINQNF